MYITRIRVKNFRSLVDADILPTNYTVLVGPNDSGKSNVLRALNLFFNNQTDVGQSLVFDLDYSQQAPIKVNRAKQIEIELEFKPPNNYTDNQPVVWKKTWRDGLSTPYSDDLRTVDGREFSPRSKTDFWVRQIGYEYVPAIRGKEFFATLKRRLHNTLAETIAPRLASASGSFLGNIRKEVGNIEAEARRLFALKTEFALPSDLGSLFEILDLKTADKHAATPLQNRGDGIQGRHIPVILRFLADQRKTNFARGKPPPETIWGYEEPENNLELIKQVDEAAEFYRCSSTIQVLLTTHSPAFYGVTKTQEKANTWFATRAEGQTAFKNSATQQALDEGLGLMPFVEPYLRAAVQQRTEMLQQLKTLHSQSMHIDRPLLCMEGATDKEVIEAACKVLFPAPLPFEIVAKPGMGAGVGWAVGYATARAVLPDLKHKTAVLFDGDEAGTEARKTLTARLKAVASADRIKAFKVGADNANDELRKVLQGGFQISVALEEICGVDAWNYAESKGWLEDRPDVVKQNASKLKVNESFADLVARRISDAACRRLIHKRVSGERKGQFAKYLVKEIENTKQVPPTLEKLVRSIHTYFS
ncbi:ATP-binding protein [Roseateles sp. DAIF2]|uniref:ATP-dependent nuclease n=1 Tax=Roseateles sp. DAIF2 TaxID=2714952 RepID=UPI0018A2EB74|nr:AAA family ATPase [Roseateles sp. DAIF2]QPF71672.1 ATP-binding protein [Roseateles sp. DAIF2]